MRNKKAWIWAIVIAIILIALFYIPKLTDSNRALVGKWNDAGIDCLPAHQNANLHIHPELQILVDGRVEGIPANVGIVKSCMAEIHTHDASGTLHVESVSAGKSFKLGDFFTVWEKPFEREGFGLTMTVDSATNTEATNLILKDKQKIILKYSKN